MKFHSVRVLAALVGGAIMAAATVAVDAAPAAISAWQVVVNNGDLMPTDTCNPSYSPTPSCRTFNSYNQPSVNANQLVVIRARSRGGQGAQQNVHGVYVRDIAAGTPVVRILDRDTLVPPPNNLETTFIEPPSFPRIDIGSDTIATRGNHQPVWEYILFDGSETRAGTSGIYTNPFGPLITGAGKLGVVPGFSFFEVPEAPGTPFDVFPGAPAVTDGATVAFKGNYTVGAAGKTGVYYRDLVDGLIPMAPAGGSNPVVLIANNTSTVIPGSDPPVIFGSTAPPSAADREAVFAGFDNEDNPTLGGIYLAPLDGRSQPPLTTLVSIGAQVPGEPIHTTFNRLGEGVSFDRRFVAFWGAWGTDMKTLVLQCPTEGNRDRIAFCNEQHPDGFEVEVSVHQGIFVHDLKNGITRPVASTPRDFDDFVYWNFSGRVPGTGERDDEDGEPARWRSASFVAVSGLVDGRLSDATFHAAFKARAGDVLYGVYADPVDGIYLRQGPGLSGIVTVIETGMDGSILDPEAIVAETGAVLPVTEMGIERDGFRGNSLVINASMGTEEAGWAGIYLTEVLK